VAAGEITAQFARDPGELRWIIRARFPQILGEFSGSTWMNCCPKEGQCSRARLLEPKYVPIVLEAKLKLIHSRSIASWLMGYRDAFSQPIMSGNIAVPSDRTGGFEGSIVDGLQRKEHQIWISCRGRGFLLVSSALMNRAKLIISPCSSLTALKHVTSRQCAVVLEERARAGVAITRGRAARAAFAPVHRGLGRLG